MSTDAVKKIIQRAIREADPKRPPGYIHASHSVPGHVKIEMVVGGEGMWMDYDASQLDKLIQILVQKRREMK